MLPRPSMTRAAGGLAARRSDRGLSSRLYSMPFVSQFQKASTKPHILVGRLQLVCVDAEIAAFSATAVRNIK